MPRIRRIFAARYIATSRKDDGATGNAEIATPKSRPRGKMIEENCETGNGSPKLLMSHYPHSISAPTPSSFAFPSPLQTDSSPPPRSNSATPRHCLPLRWKRAPRVGCRLHRHAFPRGTTRAGPRRQEMGWESEERNVGKKLRQSQKENTATGQHDKQGSVMRESTENPGNLATCQRAVPIWHNCREF